VNDIIYSRVTLQDVHGLREPHQQRPDQFRSTQALQKLIGNVARFEAGEDEYGRVLPKFENDSIATRGSRLKRRAFSDAMIAISARSSEDGSMFTVASARKYRSPLGVINK
jgi:hypothetical protein